MSPFFLRVFDNVHGEHLFCLLFKISRIRPSAVLTWVNQFVIHVVKRNSVLLRLVEQRWPFHMLSNSESMLKIGCHERSILLLRIDGRYCWFRNFLRTLNSVVSIHLRGRGLRWLMAKSVDGRIRIKSSISNRNQTLISQHERLIISPLYDAYWCTWHTSRFHEFWHVNRHSWEIWDIDRKQLFR